MSKFKHSKDEGKSRFTSSSPRIGFVLILMSGIFWFSLFAVPFLPLTMAEKTLTAGGLFAAVQLCWWTGAGLAGPRVVRKFMGRLRRSGESLE